MDAGRTDRRGTEPAVTGIRLRIEEPKLPPRLIASDAPQIVIGRDSQCDVVLQDPLVSRRHAEIQLLSDGRIALRDLGSSNGTYLDDRRIESSAWLSLPARVRVGHTKVAVEQRAPVQPAITPPLAAAVAPVAAVDPAAAVAPSVAAEPQLPTGWGAPRDSAARLGGTRPAVIAIALVAAAVVLVGALVVAGSLGKISPFAPSSSSAVGVGQTPADASTTASSPTAGTTSPEASKGPATAMEFLTTVTGATTTTKLTTDKTVCTRDPANPRSLRVEFAMSSPNGTTVSLTDADTSASPAILSKLDIKIGLPEPLHDVVVGVSDVTKLDVLDSGDHASISLSAKASGGDKVTGTITCNSIGP